MDWGGLGAWGAKTTEVKSEVKSEMCIKKKTRKIKSRAAAKGESRRGEKGGSVRQ